MFLEGGGRHIRQRSRFEIAGGHDRSVGAEPLH